MFSTKAEYGIRIMAHLDAHDGDGPVSFEGADLTEHARGGHGEVEGEPRGQITVGYSADTVGSEQT